MHHTMIFFILFMLNFFFIKFEQEFDLKLYKQTIQTIKVSAYCAICWIIYSKNILHAVYKKLPLLFNCNACFSNLCCKYKHYYMYVIYNISHSKRNITVHNFDYSEFYLLILWTILDKKYLCIFTENAYRNRMNSLCLVESFVN